MFDPAIRGIEVLRTNAGVVRFPGETRFVRAGRKDRRSVRRFWELAKQLRAHQPALKVIYVSGYSLDSSGTSLGRRDASTFLQKPYDPRKLAQTIRLCLDQK